ncbi:Aste57867_19468 [Aphanomyces stellatus]|uniref:Aste57867_19468 protein n=1 Tax=Aphanomyces stellatus TaxID=120398 RepID=A0A485LE06_9STRA|nr:hypothetical protein As57867_019404 [Aphanomyces stellatus]VFT96180.1 Aste57867_19468 [Aphanomyces stellatus]
MGPPPRAPARHTIHLCARTTSIAPAVCARDLPPRFGPLDRLHLCANATTPAILLECARRVSMTVSPPSVARLCADATSLAPAECLNAALRRGRKATASVVARCHGAEVTPTTLALGRVVKDCKTLVPHCLVHVAVDVLDQFGHHMTSVHDILRWRVVRSDGAAASASSRADMRNGTATFHVQFDRPGAHRVLLGMLNLTHELPVRVGVDADTAQWKALCDDWLFRDRLQCVAALPPLSHQVLQVDAASSSMWLLSLCVDHVWATSAARAVGGGAAVAWPWLPYHTQLYVTHVSFLHDYTIPRRSGVSLSPWDVLQVPPTATPREIRRAYRQHALEFHPDRHHRHPKTTTAALDDVDAAAYFGRLRDAYESLSIDNK